MLLDCGGRIQQCSRRVAAIFGRRPEQVSGWPIQALIPALPLLPATPGYNLAFVTFWHRGCGRLPLWGFDRNGNRLALEADLQRFRARSVSALAPVIRLFVRPRAVAGRAERGADDLDRFLRAVADSDEGVVVTDRQGSIVRVNRATERMSGCAAQQLHGRPLGQFFAALPGSVARSNVPAIWQRTGSNGHCTPIESMTRPFVDRYGAPTHLVHTLRDNSERAGSREREARATRQGPECAGDDSFRFATALPSPAGRSAAAARPLRLGATGIAAGAFHVP